MAILKELGERVRDSLNVEEIPPDHNRFSGGNLLIIRLLVILLWLRGKLKVNIYIEKPIKPYIFGRNERKNYCFSQLLDRKISESVVLDEVVSGAIVVDK